MLFYLKTDLGNQLSMQIFKKRGNFTVNTRCREDKSSPLTFGSEGCLTFLLFIYRLSDTQRVRQRYGHLWMMLIVKLLTGNVPFPKIRKDGAARIKEQSTLYYPHLAEHFSCLPCKCIKPISKNWFSNTSTPRMYTSSVWYKLCILKLTSSLVLQQNW